MLHYFKFRQELFGPVAAKDVYLKRGAGKGWPEECPPIRAANAFGFDLLANFDVTFIQKRGGGGWRVEDDLVLESDFDWAPPRGHADDADADHADDADDGHNGADAGRPLAQQYAWFWERGQKLPHPITDNVYEQIRHQVKVSTYLFLKTDPNELLLFTDVPNLPRPWRAVTALVDADWYPASYPWHVVLELPPAERRVTIRKGEPLCRVMPVRRDTYFAQQMTPHAFDDFFARGQQWLTTHGQVQHEGTVDITRTYVRQQVKSRFVVME